jgi:hypothetical protein
LSSNNSKKLITIAIDKQNYDSLRNLGYTGETFNTVISRLIKIGKDARRRSQAMSFLPSRAELYRKFIVECTKLRGINGAVVVSSGEEWECDYDESKEGDFLSNNSLDTLAVVGKKLVEQVGL